MKRIRFLKESSPGVLPEAEIENYYTQPLEQFIDMFLPMDSSYILVNETEPADICFYSVQHINEDLLRDNELNIFFSIENLRYNGHKGGKYAYYNKFGAYGSKKTDIFIMNDESYEYREEDKIVIPVIQCRIQYFNRIENIFNEHMNTTFEDKKFALMISRNGLNDNKEVLFRDLKQLGEVDIIHMYPELKTKTCYNSLELLNVFNKYKFIVVCENSHTPGYITEKIFNVFLAKSIAIYDGAPNITEFIKPGCYIPYGNNLLQIIKALMNNKNMYNKIVNNEKIQEKYKDITIKY